MRLTQIKLAGFKSFVDPTSFQLPGQLVAVVGPNGCGKSNIMDATRWVLGESRASELRGESMADVIFNGSALRKPAARASVELVFENALGRAGGQWGQFAEISVRRVLTREGGSSYFINNQLVRRKDVQDIFMGTGLGPRAYAIIGQGMISRIIEAKPEELRVFLEEAAGVSKYKERRRETEHRLQDTRDNLLRVDDILRELNAQVEKLEVQAQIAQQYRSLQNSAQDKLHYLWVLRFDEAQIERDKVRLAIEQAQTDLEAHMARLRQIERDLDMRRSAHYDCSDALNTAQAAMYEASAQVSRIETELRFMTEGRARIQGQISNIQTQTAQWQERHARLQEEVQQLHDEREVALEESEVFAAQLDQVSHLLPQFESTQRSAMEHVQDARARLTHSEQSAARAADEQRNADRQLVGLVLRRERLEQEKQTPDPLDATSFEGLHAHWEEVLAQQEASQDALAEIEEQLPQARQALEHTRAVFATEQTRAAQLQARVQALCDVQERAHSQGQLGQWLNQYQLNSRQAVWQKLQIETGWALALEAVLQERMHAFEMSRMESARNYFADVPPARQSFYARVRTQLSASVQPEDSPNTQPHLDAGSALAFVAPSGAASASLRTLLSLVRTGDPALKEVLPDWLQGVYVANTVQEAYDMRTQLLGLEPTAVIVTPEGHQFSHNCVRFFAQETEQSGMLARAQEIDALDTELRAQQLVLEQTESELAHKQTLLEQWTEAQKTAQVQLQNCSAQVHEVKLRLQKTTLEQAQREHRHAQIDEELSEIAALEEDLNAQKYTALTLFDEADAQLEFLQANWTQAQAAYEECTQVLEQQRLTHRSVELQNRDAQHRVQTLTQRLADLEYNLQSAEHQLENLAQNLEEQSIALEEFNQLNHDEGLQSALQIRVEKETLLSQARTTLDALSHELRQLDEQRIVQERALEPKREMITQLQLAEQAARLNQEQFAQQLSEAQVDVESLRERLRMELADTVRAATLQAEITRLNQQINALGAVNMAALDELHTAQERQGFLSAQAADLNLAMSTLEDAIARIDKESREMLMATYEQVNRNFGALFPELFGGGEARLVLTGDEVLDSGVQVMAHPPGKRNSTIHLLSGGEKALTATALVFALFQLNPAPFCLLDEVDAPLDDANTERFAQLVAKMSQQTQFLFISHNKITMEIADQLVGVTMQEQGVSRIVAVDMESALQLQQSANG